MGKPSFLVELESVEPLLNAEHCNAVDTTIGRSN
jgi:hypothetical protein